MPPMRRRSARPSVDRICARANQEHRAASDPVGTPRTPGVRQGAHAQANQIRGLLGEFGLVIPKGIRHVAQRVPTLLEDASNELPLAFRQLIDRLTCHLKELDQQVRELERHIIAGTAVASSVGGSRRSRASDRSQLPRSSPRSPTPGALTTAGRYRPGLGWYRDRTRVAARPRSSDQQTR